ncbi:MogA/MoaB family molybdenum cofactor biosynthesis protein [Priestia filamentosa]|uniref:MogA/MoaB family molybdenum cofactor biosynthesis protein n=1 Tax=Priestia filamentosa TaxID=1402861 RepID=UPI0039789621
MSVEEHKREAPTVVACGVITISDTRTKETDKSGALIKEKLGEKNFKVVEHVIVKDEKDVILEAVQRLINDERIEAVITNGGTGLAKRDVTIETITPLFEKEIVGFGELFRMLSYQEDIGSAALLSRAAAGVVQNTALFSLPGSSGAVKLAMDKLIIPELAHVIKHIK